MRTLNFAMLTAFLLISCGGGGDSPSAEESEAETEGAGEENDGDCFLGHANSDCSDNSFWCDTPTTNAPSGRNACTAIWTGSEMVVWEGCADSWCGMMFNTGGRYDPAANSWTTTLWTGSAMVVGEELSDTGPANTGGWYVP